MLDLPYTKYAYILHVHLWILHCFFFGYKDKGIVIYGRVQKLRLFYEIDTIYSIVVVYSM